MSYKRIQKQNPIDGRLCLYVWGRRATRIINLLVIKILGEKTSDYTKNNINIPQEISTQSVDSMYPTYKKYSSALIFASWGS